MTAPVLLIATVGELVLKGKNRQQFERRLVTNLGRALSGFAVRIEPQFGRVLLWLSADSPPADRDRVIAVVQRVFGIATLALAWPVAKDPLAIQKAVLNQLAGRTPASFAVRVNRADKGFPGTSVALERELGAAVAQATGWPVNLGTPELTIAVDIQEDGAYFWLDRWPAAGGLPVGSSGQVLALLSAGIDSPVAAWRLLRRGAQVTYLHFHSYPLTSRASIDNARALASVVQLSQPASRLLLAPLAELQKVVVKQAPSRLRVVLYRRAMFQIAERLAERTSAKAIVTGESLGQVASQTLQNLAVTQQGIQLPILRPLIGFDKQEIVDEARRLGTYEISIRPFEDCCSLLVPKSVETHADLAEVLAVEASLPWDDLVSAAVAAAQTESLG